MKTIFLSCLLLCGLACLFVSGCGMVRFAFHFCRRRGSARCFFGFVLAVRFVGCAFDARCIRMCGWLGAFFIGSGLCLGLTGSSRFGSGSGFLRSIVHYSGLCSGLGCGSRLCRSRLCSNKQGQQSQAKDFQKLHDKEINSVKSGRPQEPKAKGGGCAIPTPAAVCELTVQMCRCSIFVCRKNR